MLFRLLHVGLFSFFLKYFPWKFLYIQGSGDTMNPVLFCLKTDTNVELSIWSSNSITEDQKHLAGK